jgi:hypothetical protein
MHPGRLAGPFPPAPLPLEEKALQKKRPSPDSGISTSGQSLSLALDPDRILVFALLTVLSFTQPSCLWLCLWLCLCLSVHWSLPADLDTGCLAVLSLFNALA